MEPDLALHQSLPHLLRNLLQPDLALNQSLLNLTWLCAKASQTFSGTFSGTLLNLTWLCTKASQRNLLQNLLWNPVEPDLALDRSLTDIHRNIFRNPVFHLALHRSLPDLLRNLFRNLLGNPVEPDLALHWSLPDLLRNLLWIPFKRGLALHQSLPCRPSPEPSEPSLEPRWPWAGACTSAHRSYFWAEDPISLRCWGMKCGTWNLS